MSPAQIEHYKAQIVKWRVVLKHAHGGNEKSHATRIIRHLEKKIATTPEGREVSP